MKTTKTPLLEILLEASLVTHRRYLLVPADLMTMANYTLLAPCFRVLRIIRSENALNKWTRSYTSVAIPLSSHHPAVPYILPISHKYMQESSQYAKISSCVFAGVRDFFSGGFLRKMAISTFPPPDHPGGCEKTPTAHSPTANQTQPKLLQSKLVCHRITTSCSSPFHLGLFQTPFQLLVQQDASDNVW